MSKAHEETEKWNNKWGKGNEIMIVNRYKYAVMKRAWQHLKKNRAWGNLTPMLVASFPDSAQDCGVGVPKSVEALVTHRNAHEGDEKLAEVCFFWRRRWNFWLSCQTGLVGKGVCFWGGGFRGKAHVLPNTDGDGEPLNLWGCVFYSGRRDFARVVRWVPPLAA